MMSRRPARPECAGTRSRRAMTWIASWSGSAIEPHAGSCRATEAGIFGDFLGPASRELTSSLPVVDAHEGSVRALVKHHGGIWAGPENGERGLPAHLPMAYVARLARHQARNSGSPLLDHGR